MATFFTEGKFSAISDEPREVIAWVEAQRLCLITLLKERGLSEISLYEDLLPRRGEGMPFGGARRRAFPEPPPFPLDTAQLSDTCLQVLYPLWGWIEDYSCIGFGFRDYLTSLRDAVEEEAEKRHLKLTLMLYDLPRDFKVSD